MSNWTEREIGIIYYGGLTIALLVIVAVLWFLQPRLREAVKAIFSEKTATFWGHALQTTAILLGLIGALSVTFHGCHISYYDFLIEYPVFTIGRGLTQVSRGMVFLGRTLLAWLLFFGLYYLLRKRPPDSL